MGFLIGLSLVMATITGAFEQGQNNVEASNFFESTSTAHNPNDKAYIVDELN